MPETIGWQFVLAVLVLVICYALYRCVRRWRANGYRRQALRELHDMKAKEQLQQLPALLKRVAMHGYGREKVASLSGQSWLQFLDGTLGGEQFRCGPGSCLPGLAYADLQLTSAQRQQLVALSARWIRGHRGAGDV